MQQRVIEKSLNEEIVVLQLAKANRRVFQSSKISIRFSSKFHVLIKLISSWKIIAKS